MKRINRSIASVQRSGSTILTCSPNKRLRALAVLFRQLRPEVSGKLKIDFLPVVNYTVLHGLEVEPE